jgi:hypothetical protein
LAGKQNENSISVQSCPYYKKTESKSTKDDVKKKTRMSYEAIFAAEISTFIKRRNTNKVNRDKVYTMLRSQKNGYPIYRGIGHVIMASSTN